MSTPNDITEELRRDREKGAKRLVDEYKDSLLLFALKLCDDNYYSAEALVYQTFFDVLAKIEEYDAAKGDFTGWMRGMMKRCHAKNSRRKSDKTVVLAKDIPEVPDDGAEYVYKSVDSAILRDAICAMPKEMKDVVVLHYFMDAPIAQMARTLAIPVGTVKSRLHYAKLALRKRLGATVKKHITALVFAGIALFSTAAVLVSSAIATGEATSLSGEEVRGKREEVRGKRGEGRGAVATSATLPYDSNEMISSEKQTAQGGNTMNMKNATAALAAVAMTAAAPLPAAAGTVTLDGKIVIEYDGSGSSATVSTPGGASETITGKVTEIVATPADGETLTLTGDALTFSDGAAITMAADGNLVIENNVTIAQTLSLARSDGAYQVWNNTAVANIDANTEPVVIPGAGLYSLRDDKWQIVSICAGVSHSASCYGRYDAVGDLEFAEVTPSGGNNYWHCIFPANRWDGLNTWSARLQLYQYNDSPDVRLDIKAFGHGLDYSYEPTTDLYSARYPTDTPTNYVQVATASMGLDHVILRKSTASPASIGFKGRLTVQSSYNIDVAAGVELAILSGNGTTVNMPKLSGDGNVRFARDVGLVVDCMMKDSTWNITNSLVQTAGAITNMIPTNAVVNIWDGGVFYPRTQGLNTGDGLSAGRADFKVHSGGELRFYSGDGKLSSTQHLENDGGIVWMGYPYSVSAFAGSGDSVSDGVMGMFLNRITLSNGAVVKGRKIRIGNNNDALWRVSGSLPSYFNSHAHFYGYGGKPWVFDVENATGDDDIDFYFNGYITNHVGASYRTSAIIKKGAGTMRIGGTVETHKPLEIREGALIMGENGGPAEASTVKSVVVGAGATLEIEGGEMSFGDIVLGDGATLKIDGGAMAFGILTMTNATIELGSGATVAFADSSASEWSGTLTVNGYSRYGAVRFGTSTTGLTAEQLSAVSLKGGAALKIVYDGSLVPDNISNMPSGVPYIESDGTQYINLGYNVGPNTTVRFDFAMAETDHNVRPFGARGDQRCGLGYSGGMYFSFFFDNNSTKKSDIIQDRNCHTAFFDFASGKCGIDSWSDSFTPASGKTSQQPLFVFAEAVNNGHTYIYSPAEANGNGYYLPAKAKVYGVKIFESGEEVRNFVPCLKRGYLLTPNASNETCVAGLKETHTGYFHTSENLLQHPLAYGGDILTENDDAYVSSERNVLAQGVETNMLIDTNWKFLQGERVDLDFALLTPDTDGENPFPAGIEPTVISGVQTNADNTTTEILRVGAFSDGSHTNFQFVLGGGSQEYPKYPVATAYGVRRTLSFTHNKIRVITAGYTNIDWTSSSPFSEGFGMLKIGAQGLRYVSERSGQTLNSATNFAPMKIYGFRVYNASDVLQSEYIPSVANGVPGLMCERKGAFWKARSLTQPQYLSLNPTDEDKAKDYPERYSDTVINTAGYTNMVFSIYGETNQVFHAESDRDAYLEFDGENGHCINTGYVVTPNTRIEMDLSLWFTGHRDNKRQQFFLSQAPAGGETGIWFRFFLRGTGYYAYKYRDNDDNQGGWQDIGGANGGGYPVTPSRRRFVFDGFQNKVQMIAMDGEALHDGELNNVPRTATECSDGSTLWVASNGRMLEHGACMKLYGLKLYESGVLQREYVPYRNGDERGLYDIVEGTKLPLTNNVGAAVGRVSGGDWRRGDGERVILLTVGRRHEQTLKCVAAGQIGEYRWYRNGELMPGQTGDTLTVSCEEPGTRTVYTVVPRYEIFGVEYEDGVPATAVVESYKSGMVSIFR